MRIEHLLEQHLENSKQILKESCDGLSIEQRVIVEGIYNELSPLLEVALTTDQIKNIFQNVEKNASAGGANRTLIGKGIDTAKQVDAALNKLGKWLQNTTPVQNFDAKFERLKANINKKFPDSKILDTVSNMGIWAEKNPGKTAAVIGILTTVAALAGGPVGGAIAGQILKGSVELLKGEKLSTAVGRGMKAAAYGWLAGKSFELIGDAIKGSIDLVASAFDPNVQFLDMSYVGSRLDNSTFRELKIYGRAEDLTRVQGVFDQASDAWRAGDYGQAENLFNQASTMADRLNSMEYISKLVPEIERADAIYAAGKNAGTLFKGLGAAAQGAATGATGVPKKGESAKENYYIQARPLSEGQVYMLFNRIEQLNEGPVWDKVKSGAKKVAAAAGQKISTVGTNLTTKITADKLNSAWTKAGSPKDSAALAKFLKSQGVDDAAISQTFKAMKLKVGDAAQTGYAQVRTQLTQLNTKQKRQLAAYLQKQLGTA